MYDLAIVGGGLAGLALSIQAARAGFKTILFEKDRYPFHRVCGEYISLESWKFLESLGLNLSDSDLPIIKNLLVSSPSGNSMQLALPLGGFGISRYKIDHDLAMLAKDAGVQVLEATKVDEIVFDGPYHILQSSAGEFKARVCCAATGKRSNLDLKWKRPFAKRKANKLNNFIGVKYHVRMNNQPELISLHNFKDGYCGISAIENSTACLCYLTTAANLASNGNSIKKMENSVLCKNPFLKRIFNEAEFLFDQPIVISQISFEKKSQIEDHTLMLGDAAGMITPLCGNGMSMALHASKLAYSEIESFLKDKNDRAQMEERYSTQWKAYFASRLRVGRSIQKFFGSALLSNILVSGLKPFPGVGKWLVRQTHGQPF